MQKNEMQNWTRPRQYVRCLRGQGSLQEHQCRGRFASGQDHHGRLQCQPNHQNKGQLSLHQRSRLIQLVQCRPASSQGHQHNCQLHQQKVQAHEYSWHTENTAYAQRTFGTRCSCDASCALKSSIPKADGDAYARSDLGRRHVPRCMSLFVMLIAATV